MSLEYDIPVHHHSWHSAHCIHSIEHLIQDIKDKQYYNTDNIGNDDCTMRNKLTAMRCTTDERSKFQYVYIQAVKRQLHNLFTLGRAAGDNAMGITPLHPAPV